MNEALSTAQDLPRRLKRSIILYTGLGLLLTGAIVATVCIYPTHQQLRKFADRELQRNTQSHALTIEQYLSRITDTTLQITSRTRIRDLLVEYNQGKISRNELVAFSQPKLADALRLASDDVGMTRLDASGKVAVEVNEAPSWNSMGLSPEELQSTLLRGPIMTPAGYRLMVAAPIYDRSRERVGTDLVAFSLNGLSQIIKELSHSDDTGQIQLLMRIEDRFHSLSAETESGSLKHISLPQTVLGKSIKELTEQTEDVALTVYDENKLGTNDVISLIPLNSLDWVLSDSIGQSELYAIPNQLLRLLIPIIIVLVLLGGVGSILLLNPLAGKVIVQTGRYSEEIRQRTNALADLKSAHSRIDNILKSVPSGLIVFNTDHQVILANEVAAHIFGCNPASVTGRKLEELTMEGVLPEDFGCLNQLFQQQRSEFEFTLEHNDHSPRFIRAECSVMKSSDGDLNGAIIILQDITRDRELDRMKNEFISTAAHELRTPLTALLGYTDLLSTANLGKEFSNEQKIEFLKEITSKGESLSTMVDDLLDVSRIESGQPLPLHPKACDLLTVVRKAVDQFSMFNREHHFTTELALPPSGCQFQLDPDRIHQVMENLLSNAVKYSSPGSLINVKGEPLKNTYQVIVSDEGIGIADSDLPKLFSKFYRVDASDTAVRGLGLGLSVVQQIIKGHKGEIHVESVPTEGTKVIIRLPMIS